MWCLFSRGSRYVEVFSLSSEDGDPENGSSLEKMGVEGVSGMSSSEISDREVVEPVGELVMEAEGDRVGVTGTDSRE